MSAKNQLKLDDQRGRITFHGKLATQFWVRTLGLEGEVEEARRLMGDRIELKWGAIPIIAEYQVDENFKWIYIVLANVDILGIRDGCGVIYFASPGQEEPVKKVRDEYADDLMKDMWGKRKFDEVIVMDEKKER